jgi:DMSO/TMAO reductase YedYZ heme-binding membrane subunit
MKRLSQRTKHRILFHHLPLALVCGASLFTLYSVLDSDDVKFRLSMATGYLGLVLLGATLVTGALNVLRNLHNPVSTDLRRDIGIWCGTISLAHVVIGLQVHLGSMVLYFFREAGESKRLVPRFDLFGFANYTGLIAGLVIVLLLVLSNDASLRLLGKNRWKFLQRWNYAVVVLVVLHSIAYQILERRQWQYLFLFSVIVGTALIVQVSGFRRQRRKAAGLS